MAGKGRRATPDDGCRLALIGAIYDAALKPERWPAFLEAFSESLWAGSGMVVIQDVSRTRVGFAISYGRDETRVIRDYGAHYLPISPYIPIMASLPETVYLTQNLLPEADLARTEYYNDWLRPQRVHYHAGANVLRRGNNVALVELNRSRRAGPFGEAEQREFRFLFPHLRRAVQLNVALAEAGAWEHNYRAVLNGLALGVVFLDGEGRAAWCNRLAEGILREGGPLRCVRGRLDAVDSIAAGRLRHLVAGAVRTGIGRDSAAGGALLLQGDSAAAPMRLLISPLPPGRVSSPAGVTACAVALLFPPDAATMVPAEVLQALHGLTPAEARLACALADGLSLAEAAERFSVTLETVRSQLKAVCAKTGVRRQAEVVRLVLTGSPGFLRPADTLPASRP